MKILTKCLSLSTVQDANIAGAPIGIYLIFLIRENFNKYAPQWLVGRWILYDSINITCNNSSGTIALITCRSGSRILLGEVNIYDKEMARVLSRCCYYFNSLTAYLCWWLGAQYFYSFWRGIGVAVFLLLSGFGLTRII